MSEVVGWAAAVILLITIGRQVYTQWRSGSTAGVSKWLFVGQTAASAGFVLYSYLVKDWVFVTTNSAMLVTAIVGQINYFCQNRRSAKAEGAARYTPGSLSEEPSTKAPPEVLSIR